MKPFAKMLEKISQSSYIEPYRVLSAFARLTACSVHGFREEEYLEEAKHWDADQMKAMAQAFGQLQIDMEEEPYTDLLGPLSMEHSAKSTNDRLGKFYTPVSICDMMAMMTLGQVELPPDGDRIRLMEPCAGGGQMMLSCYKELRRQEIPFRKTACVCIDIDRLACDICFLNLTLWAIPVTVVHGNALTLETWGSWRNIFWSGLGIGREPEPVPAAETEAMIEAAHEYLTAQGQMVMEL